MFLFPPKEELLIVASFQNSYILISSLSKALTSLNLYLVCSWNTSSIYYLVCEEKLSLVFRHGFSMQLCKIDTEGNARKVVGCSCVVVKVVDFEAMHLLSVYLFGVNNNFKISVCFVGLWNNFNISVCFVGLWRGNRRSCYCSELCEVSLSGYQWIQHSVRLDLVIVFKNLSSTSDRKL